MAKIRILFVRVLHKCKIIGSSGVVSAVQQSDISFKTLCVLQDFAVLLIAVHLINNTILLIQKSNSSFYS